MRRRPQRAIRTATLFPYTSPFRYQARDAALERIEPIDGVVGMSTCGLVIEAATEREEIKRSIFEAVGRSEEHTSELQSLMRISHSVFCLKKKNQFRSLPFIDRNYHT